MTTAAIPTNGGQVAEHFGRCPKYTIVALEENCVKERRIVENPGHKPGYLPKFLAEQGVDCILAKGIGQRAVDLFSEQGIKVSMGVSGSVEEVIEDYRQGKIEAGGEVCGGHDEGHSHNHRAGGCR